MYYFFLFLMNRLFQAFLLPVTYSLFSLMKLHRLLNLQLLTCLVVVFRYVWQQHRMLSTVCFRPAPAFTSSFITKPTNNRKKKPGSHEGPFSPPVGLPRCLCESGREPMLLLSRQQHLLSAGVVNSVCA